MQLRTYRCQTCADGSGNPRGVIPSPNGSMWQTCPTCHGARQIQEEPTKAPGWYPLQLIVPLNGTQQGSILIQNEDFDIEQFLVTYTNAALSVTILQNGRSWTIAPNVNTNQGSVPVTLLAGTAASPFLIYPAYRIHVREQLEVIATDSSGAQNTLNFVLFGKRLIGQATQRNGAH